ncbi:MAG: pyrroline-5-carboxylate reductase [Gammaproteobacteria bacterium]|nr:pyrroline-5-carboxylate reductase [Gammaproteobacteria bacterium]
MKRNIVLLGFGNMGQALVRGWLERGIAPESIRVADPAPAALDAAAKLGVRGAAAATDALRGSAPDIVVMAVKPGQLAGALRSLTQAAAGGRPPLVLSIAAGKPIAALTAELGADAAVVRAMPNTPAAIGRGMTVLTASPQVAAAQRELATDLMSAVGAVEWVDDEAQMDAVTAVSGSGPAYVFLLIEALTRAGVAVGLDERLATRLATVTVAGAGAYAESSGDPAAELRRRVTSPGGTTEAALRVLMDGDAMAKLLAEAVLAAAARGRELSEA